MAIRRLSLVALCCLVATLTACSSRGGGSRGSGEGIRVKGVGTWVQEPGENAAEAVHLATLSAQRDAVGRAQRLVESELRVQDGRATGHEVTARAAGLIRSFTLERTRLIRTDRAQVHVVEITAEVVPASGITTWAAAALPCRPSVGIRVEGGPTAIDREKLSREVAARLAECGILVARDKSARPLLDVRLRLRGEGDAIWDDLNWRIDSAPVADAGATARAEGRFEGMSASEVALALSREIWRTWTVPRDVYVDIRGAQQVDLDRVAAGVKSDVGRVSVSGNRIAARLQAVGDPRASGQRLLDALGLAERAALTQVAFDALTYRVSSPPDG